MRVLARAVSEHHLARVALTLETRAGRQFRLVWQFRAHEWGTLVPFSAHGDAVFAERNLAAANWRVCFLVARVIAPVISSVVLVRAVAVVRLRLVPRRLVWVRHGVQFSRLAEEGD